MSNKKVSTVKNTLFKFTLAPKLRFPVFRDKGEWDCALGNSVFDQVSNKSHSSDLPILAVTQEYGAIPRDMIDYHVSVTDSSIESYKVVEIGDFIISLRSFQGGVEFSKFRGICSPAYVILRLKPGHHKEYFKYYLKTERFIVKMTKNLEGLRDGKMISYKQFSELNLPIPELNEQQKIADCLASLDECLGLASKKLDELRAHKQGLLQQLFPANGEPLPKLRFPEFLDAGAWSFQSLGKLAKRSTRKNTDGTLSRVLTNSAEHGVVDQRDFFDKDIANQGNLDGYYIVEMGAYVYNPRISTTAPVGPISKNRIGTGVMSPLYTILNFNNSQNDFYAHYFRSTHWHLYMRQSSSTGARHDRMSITNDAFLGLPLPVSTPEEQQKIADCLASIDDLIAVQRQKVDELKAHKEGLLQQLFPSMAEVHE